MGAGKIVLGISAAVVTVSSNIAFNTVHKFNAHRVLGATRKGSTKCRVCISLWTNSGVGGGHFTHCKTSNLPGARILYATKTAGVAAHTWAWRTAATFINRTKCGNNKVTLVTTEL